MAMTYPLSAQPLDIHRHQVVTRHPGARAWLEAQLGQPVHSIAHLNPQDIVPGCCYYGVFPLNLAAAICAAGAECWAISMDMPPHLRGQELSADQLRQLGATLVRYDVRTLA